MTPGDGIPPRKSADKNLGEIVAEVSEKASLLVREEIELAKAEVTTKSASWARAAGSGSPLVSSRSSAWPCSATSSPGS